jgi:putative transposase
VKVALAAVWDEKTLAQMAQQFDVHPTQITTWQGQLLEGAAEVFGSDSQSEPVEPAIDVKTLHAKTGELGLVNDCVRGAQQDGTVADRKTMTDWTHGPSVTRQAREPGISRSGVYYLPRPAADAALPTMRRLCELHMDFPSAGSRMMGDLLVVEGVNVGRLRGSMLMEKVAIEASCRRPNMSKPVPGCKAHPYLLSKLPMVRPKAGLGHRHHRHNLHSHCTKRRLSERYCRLADPAGASTAAVDQAQGRPLYRGIGGSAGTLWAS